MLQAGGISFGPGFAVTDGGTATISITGSDSFAGTLLVPASDSMTLSGGAAVASLTLGAQATVTVGATASLFIDTGKTAGVANSFSLVNNAAIQVQGGYLAVGSGAVLSGSGSLVVSAGGTVSVNGTVSAGQTIAFADSTGFLNLVPLGSVVFNGGISGFRPGDSFVYPVVVDALSYANGVLSFSSQGSIVGSMAFSMMPGTTLYLQPDTNGYGTLITASQVARSFNGGTADFHSASAWTVSGTSTPGAPLAGDTLAIASGTITLSAADMLSYGAANAVTLNITGGSNATPVAIQLTDSNLGTRFLTQVTGTNAVASLAAIGTSTNQGLIFVTGANATLNLSSSSDGSSSALVNSGDGDISVGTEGSVVLTSGTLVNNAAIAVAGSFTVASGSTLSGGTSGTVQVQGTGKLVLQGRETGDQFNFLGPGARITIGSLAGFATSSAINNMFAGDTIDVAGVVATALSYASSSGILSLLNGGTVVGSFAVNSYDGGTSYALSSDGAGGTLVTYQPAVTAAVVQLPVPVVLLPGNSTSLAAMLQAAFGNALTGVSSVGVETYGSAWLKSNTYLYFVPDGSATPNVAKVSSFSVGASAVNQLGPNANWPSTSFATTVPVGQIATVTLAAGNAISRTAFIGFSTTGTAANASASNVTYAISVVNPNVIGANAFSGVINPSDIVAAAQRISAFYGVFPDSEDCSNLGNAVAAAAGAPLPFTDYLSDPGGNLEGGFWRIAYRGSAQANPTANWNTLVQAGDIVRMGWAGSLSPHTTEVLSVNTDGSLTVFDDIYAVAGSSVSYAGIHSANYWPFTDPSTITIYRLDPNHQYLINGVANGQYIQGSVYNNLIRPNFTNTIVTAGAASNEIQGVSTILSGTTVTDFHAGDTIDVTDLAVGSSQVAYNAGSGVLTLTNGGTTVTMTLAAGLAQSFSLASDGNGGTLVAACYAEGTRIATTRGPVAIEDLRVGDRALTAAGRSRPIVWLGRRRVEVARHPRPQDVMPVRVREAAFGAGLPSRDLVLSPDHAVFVAGVLIPVRQLLNGASIVQESVRRVTWWHLELDAHDVVLAEGLPAESYLDTGNRSAFEGCGPALQLHPDFARRVWDARGHAPLVLSGPELARVRTRLLQRLEKLGHDITDDPELELFAGAVLLEPQIFDGWMCVVMPDDADTLRLASRLARPAELDPHSDDWREVGVPLTGLRVDGVAVALDDASFVSGWREPERELRWTTGDAWLRVAPGSLVELRLPRFQRYHALASRAAAVPASLP